ncbi:MAG: lamin tail domain-containing protein [Crocinitomicaceae bacterium]|nr:lamin tail domain-containing protein [Crocinitomicaceae bacterium]
MKRISGLLLAVLLYTHSNGQTLFINEIVASNKAGTMDDFFEHDDWVEIYNGGGLINLAGYYVSDDASLLTKWLIPSTNPGVTYILPNDHLILWVDKDPQQGEDHVDFSLNADGETFFLVAPDGNTIIDSVTYPLMAPDVSYGRVSDGNSNWIYFNTPTFNATNTVIPPSTEILFINEVQTVNTSTYHDQQFDYDQWIEIYNPNAFQVNLASYTITINGIDWLVPGTNPYWTVIPPHGFIALWFDNELGIETNHAPMTLDLSGGTIVLKGPNGNTVDQFTYPSIAENKSYGRQSDGSPTSVVFAIPTPRVSNTTIYIQPAELYINEVMPKNTETITDNFGQYEDWFEIYNPGANSVNLSGYYFSDNPGNPVKWVVPGSFPDSVTVPAHGWLLFWADEDQSQGVLHTSFKLSNNYECLSLYSPDGFTLTDEICWSDIGADSSYGRVNDGAAHWWVFVSSTPEASNNSGSLDISEKGVGDFLPYPNPASDHIYFDKKLNVSVRAIDGRLIGNFYHVNGLYVADWSDGVYIISDENGRISRLIKSN